MAVAREHNHAITNRVDRVAEVSVAAAHSVPIFAEVSVQSNAARFIISAGIRFTDRKIEAVRQSGKRCLRGKAH